MSTAPVEIVGEWLQNLVDPRRVDELVAPDAKYVSLNVENEELKRILPWTGTSFGPTAFVENLSQIFERWEVEQFNPTTVFGSDEDVAVFGEFTYRSKALGKRVSSPFSIHVKVVDGKVVYLQFLEDTYATASSFRLSGSWTVQTDGDKQPYVV